MDRSIKRIYKELQRFEEEKYPDIFIKEDETDIRQIKALIIGPENTPFEGGFFYFSLFLENYPSKPPKVKFLTPDSPSFRIHPNLYANGKVCLSILNTWGSSEWSPMLTISKILLTIQALLDENPAANEPPYTITKNSKTGKHYAFMSRLLTMQAVPRLLNRQDMLDEFRMIMRNYIDKHSEVYNRSFATLDEQKNENVHTFHGNYIIKNYRWNL
jgi:ubiquitin-protein ligase